MIAMAPERAPDDGFDAVLARLLDGAEKRVELLVAGGSQSVPLDEAVTDEP